MLTDGNGLIAGKSPYRTGANRYAVPPAPVGKETGSGYPPNPEYIEGTLIASVLLAANRSVITLEET